jgi:hypothetical protein
VTLAMPHPDSAATGEHSPTDYFALLELPRSPWVDPLLLKKNYHASASLRHPDHAGGSQSRFLALAEAVSCLREVHTRLRHLVELEFPAHHGGAAFRPDADLFQGVASSLNDAKRLQSEFRRATTKLARSTMLPNLVKAIHDLEKQLAGVKKKRAEQDELCRKAEADWIRFGPVFWSDEASRALFYSKWQRELEDALFACRNLVATKV